MPFRDPEARRAYDRQRYAEKHGLNSAPIPQFVPATSRAEKIPGFGNSRQDVLLDKMRRNWKPIAYTAAGIAMIVGAGLFIVRYGPTIRDRISKLTNPRPSTGEEYLSETEKSNRSLGNLLDHAQDYMDRMNSFQA